MATGGIDDLPVALRLGQHGIVAAPLSVHYLGEPPSRRELVLGFGGYDEPQMATAIKNMAAVLRAFVAEVDSA